MLLSEFKEKKSNVLEEEKKNQRILTGKCTTYLKDAYYNGMQGKLCLPRYFLR